MTTTHRKVYSQGTIPFAWEDSPGVSKLTNPINLGLHDTLNMSLPTPPSDHENKGIIAGLIPPPPCSKLPQQPPRRSLSLKGLKWWHEEDNPFVAAYKECTKDVENVGKSSETAGKRRSKVKKKDLSRFMFSCKSSSCDVEDDSLIGLCSLPSVTKHRLGRISNLNYVK